MTSNEEYNFLMDKREKYQNLLYQKSINFLRFKEGSSMADDLIKGLAAHLAYAELIEERAKSK